MFPGKNTVVLFDAASRQWLAFAHPHRVIEARAVPQVLPALRDLESETERGRWAAGFLAYEAAPAFDPALQTRPAGDFPLLWFAVFTAPKPTTAPPHPGLMEDLPWQPSLSQQDYSARFAQIKKYIAAGHTYQVNFSFRLRAPFHGDPWQLFAGLAHAQRSGFPAYVDAGKHVLCSASPELFFSLQGETLISRPMKGTADRGLLLADDKVQAQRLLDSEKNRAENLMIVDMVRNDMGRVARPGSVTVSRLFELEPYPTLWQMTSTVQCRTRARVVEILQALFPAASITGAPKVRTMQLIASLENTPRHIYTGAIGYLAPRRRAQFNVAIRTLATHTPSRLAEYGVGGGIVWDSQAQDEWHECQTKARLLTQPYPDFALLETVRWSPPDGYYLLEEHLARLRDSALYFSRPIDLDSLRCQLQKLALGFASRPRRVRILLPQHGKPLVESLHLTPLPEPYGLRLATRPVDSHDVFLYHKTTHRQVFETARADAPGCDDVLLWNERGDLTESCIANLALQINGQLLTPPGSAGLLPGTERARWLASGKLREAPLRREDLARAEKVCLLNSLRGLWEVALRT